MAGGRVLTTGFAGGAPPGARTPGLRPGHVRPHRHPPDRRFQFPRPEPHSPDRRFEFPRPEPHPPDRRPLAPPARPPAPSLLVLRALGLGDLLTAVPALRALAAAFPEHRRFLAAPRALAPLVALADPGFELLDTPAWVAGAARPDLALAARLPRGALAVNLHGRGPESHRLLRAAAPERLIGFGVDGGPAWDEDEHEVLRWCRLLQAHGIPADPSDLDLSPPASDPAPLDSPLAARAAAPAGYTLIHPGAASAARRWPAERWAAVARGERAQGRRVLLSGSAAEAPLAAEIAERAGLPPDVDLAGRTDGHLAALIALVACAGRVTCGDTGVAHLATALRVPSVVLFGPTDPRRWGPPSDRPWHSVLWAGASGDPHAAAPDPGLLEIQPGEVLAALSALPAPPPRPAPHAP